MTGLVVFGTTTFIRRDGEADNVGDVVKTSSVLKFVSNESFGDIEVIVGVVVVVDPGVVPINSRGEKQRMHLRDGFLSDLLDPIYVAYNM